MTVQSIKITDGSTNTSTYSYGDNTGSWQSIKVVNGESAAAKQLNKLSTVQSAKQHWNGLSNTAKIAIACSVLGVLLLVIIIYTAVCIVQRKKGRAEKAIADRAWDEQQNELMDYRKKMAKGDFAVSYMGHGEKF
jgi:beta-lactamase regulating signal transducer with metallopeptidase domain